MNKSVVAAGFSCVDVYEKLDKWYPTGNGVDWGVHLSRMGIQTAVVSVVGNDVYGKRMIEALHQEGIDITHLHVEEGETCKMLMDLKDGWDRVHLEEIEGVMKDFALSEEDKDFIASYDYMHTDLFGNVLKDLKEIKERGVSIIMDFSVFSDDPQYHAQDCFPYVDYAFLSYEEDNAYIREHMKQIWEQGAKLVTATFGEKGSLCYDGKTYHSYGIVACDVVNTVGAGDSYIAGFTYGILHGYSIQDCMKKGAEVSAQVVSKFEPY